MLSNGMGKARAGREGHARRAASWRLLFLSTGEIALADKIAEGGARIAAGMEVRVVDLRADAGKGLGIFEDLHGAPDAATFAHDLKRAASSFYGTAARAFLEAITEDLDGVRENLAELRRAFIGAALGPGADGQVRRVADRFALVAAGGEIATRLGITGWPEGEAIEAALTCLRSWIAERGGTGSGEIAEAKRRLAEALELYGQSRFQKFHRNADRAVITPRWGFVRSVGDDGEELPAWEFFLHPAALREVLSGFDLRSVTDALVAEGIIVTEAPKHEKAPTRYVPNGGSRMRLYQIDAEALSGRGSGHADDA
jgi:putative DNA primase/helicase